jgi:hypothetical protein
MGLALGLAVLGLNRFKKSDRFNFDRYTANTTGTVGNSHGLTEDYWPMFGLGGGVGTVLGWAWLLLLGFQANHMMKISVHILTTYLAVVSVLCFWSEHFLWGVTFAIGAALQFLYVISVIDRYELEMIWFCIKCDYGECLVLVKGCPLAHNFITLVQKVEKF